MKTTFSKNNLFMYEVKTIKSNLKAKLLKLKTEKAKNNAKVRTQIKLNDLALKLQELRTIPKVTNIKIYVEWKKSSTWGMNPHAEVYVSNGKDYERLQGMASGCGYDKLSAAIATALNQSDLLKGTLLQRIRKLNAINVTTYNGTYAIYKNLSFMGGVGVTPQITLFRELGYKVDHFSSNTSDTIIITK